jgi:uncharacterized protein YndB with AHSA1/START domain
MAAGDLAAKGSIATELSSELLITRIFDAPRTLVWQAWTDPHHLARWWGPKDFTLQYWKADLRPGGSYRFNIRGPDGADHWNQGVYREVVPPERLVIAGGWTDADGNSTSPVMVTVVTLEEHDRKTKLTLLGSGFESVSARDSHRDGWTSSFERLADYLEML